MRDADVLEPRLSYRPVIENIEGIDYYYGDTVYTVDGLPVSTIEPERELTQSEKEHKISTMY